MGIVSPTLEQIAWFWRAGKIGLGLLYAAAIALAATGQADHRVVRLAAIIVVAHVLEVPVAFIAVKGRGAEAWRVVGGTLLFGFFYWLPVRRGVGAGSA